MLVQRGLSKSVKKVILKNHLQGMSQLENARSSSPPGSKLTPEEIDSVVQEFGNIAEQRGLETVSKDYGVSNVTKDLAAVARFKRENKIEFSDMIEGGKIAVALQKFGAGMPEFEQFLSSVYSRSLEKGYTPNEIIAQSSKLGNLEKKYGMVFEKLKENYEETGRSLSLKKKEAADLQDQIAQLTKRKSDLMVRYSLDDQKVQDFATTKQQLVSLGLEVNNLPAIKNFLVALKSGNFDSKEILSKLNSISDLQAQKSKLQQEVSSTKRDLEDKKILLSEVQKLEEARLGVDQIQRLRSIIAKISSDNKIDSQQAYTRFEQDILLNYNSMLGIRPETSRLEENKKRVESDIDSARKEFESLKISQAELIKKLEEKYSKQKADIEAFNELRAMGIDAKRMRDWHQIIKTSNLDFGTIEGELRNQANLKALEDKVSSKLKELLAEELKLNQSISNLNKEKQNVELSIKAIRESTLNEIDNLGSKIMASLSSLNDQAQTKLEETAQRGAKTLDNIRETSDQNIKLIADTALTELKETVSGLKSSAGDFTQELKTVIEQASPEIKNVGIALDAGERIGKYRNILPLLQLMDGSGNGDESEALIAMWNLTSRFNTWLDNHYPNSKKEISRPLADLLESINREIQSIGGE
ncbi:MAG: hypothetical protein OK439_00805 [Thaumarchaeota archaeon]|nr:hypothetical protein [Nitrososphaerota archaeon]